MKKHASLFVKRWRISTMKENLSNSSLWFISSWTSDNISLCSAWVNQSWANSLETTMLMMTDVMCVDWFLWPSLRQYSMSRHSRVHSVLHYSTYYSVHVWRNVTDVDSRVNVDSIGLRRFLRRWRTSCCLDEICPRDWLNSSGRHESSSRTTNRERNWWKSSCRTGRRSAFQWSIPWNSSRPKFHR